MNWRHKKESALDHTILEYQECNQTSAKIFRVDAQSSAKALKLMRTLKKEA